MLNGETITNGIMTNPPRPIRFSAERQQDQAHISGLVEDAQTVEAALIRGSRNNQEQNGNGQHQGHRSVDAGGNSSRGGGDDAGIAAGLGGGGSSMGGSIGTSKSTMSNAYVEPSEAKEDPNFISLDQASDQMLRTRVHEALGPWLNGRISVSPG